MLDPCCALASGSEKTSYARVNGGMHRRLEKYLKRERCSMKRLSHEPYARRVFFRPRIRRHLVGDKILGLIPDSMAMDRCDEQLI